MKAWHEMNFDAVEDALATSGERGISRKSARERLKKDGVNNVFKAQRGDLSFYLRRVVSNPLCFLMLISSIVIYIFGRRSTAFILAAFALFSLAVIFTVYVRSRRILENMDEYSLPRVKVQRDGRIYEISQMYVARGDLILLDKGDIVPADSRLVWCEGLSVRETGITGATLVRDKDADFVAPQGTPPEKCRNMLYAASIIEDGRAAAICCEIGENTLIARTKSKRKRPSFEGLRTMIMLRRISGTLTAALLLCVFAITVYCMLPLYKGDLVDGYLLSLAFCTGVMSEFYTAFGTIIIAGGIYGTLGGDKKERGAVIKNPAAIDRLSDTNVVIMPIDALYDESDMKLETVYAEDDDYSACNDDAVVKKILEIAAVAGGVYGASRLALAGTRRSLTYEEEEILRALGAMGVMAGELSEKYTLKSHKKTDDKDGELSISLVSSKSGDLLCVKGDIDKVISMCKYRRTEGRIEPISDSDRERLISLAYTLCEGGHRIKAVASKSFAVKRFAERDSQMIFEGLLSFSLGLLSSAVEDAKDCERSGVSLLVFAREREEALGVMRALGIADDKTIALSSQRLALMSDEMLRTDIELYRLCYGLSGAEKLRIIKALRANKKTVTFMGTELSDIVLMRAADSSVTFGSTLSGKNQERIHYKAGVRDACDAMRFCSDVIVTPVRQESGGFSSVIRVIERARNIHAGIFRMLRYLISVNVARFIMLMFTILTGIELISAEQLLILSLAVDLAAVFSIVFEPVSGLYGSRISRDEIRHPISSSFRAIILGLVMGIIHILTAFMLPRIMPGVNILAVTFLEALLLEPIVLFETVREESIFTGGLTISAAYLFVFMLVIAIALLVSFTSFGALFAVPAVSVKSLLAALVGVLMFGAISEMMKLV